MHMDMSLEHLLNDARVPIIFEQDSAIHLKELTKFLQLFELAGKKLCTTRRIQDCAELLQTKHHKPYQQFGDYLQRKNIFLAELSKTNPRPATGTVIAFPEKKTRRVAAKATATPKPRLSGIKPSFNPIIERISYNSPLEIAMVAIPTILVSGVILAGGEVDIDFKNMKFIGRCNSLLDAIKKLTKAFKQKP